MPYTKSAKTEFSRVFRLLKQSRGTKTTDFIAKYHKSKPVYSNKIAYLAGLVDGEGYIKVEKSGTVRVIIGMCDEKTIDWIYDNFGGNTTVQKTRAGKPFYVWRMNQGRDLFWLMLLLVPFLVTKKDVVIAAFEKIIKTFGKLEHSLGYSVPHIKDERGTSSRT